MAANRVRKFLRLDDLMTFLNGGVVGGVVNRAANAGIGGSPMPLGLTGLVGKTLIFSQPGSFTVTFVTSDGSGGSAEPSVGTNPDKFVLFLKDLKLQIEAALGSAVVVSADGNGNLVITEATPASGVTISHTGTANPILGFDKSVDTVGKFYSPVEVSPTPPCWVWAYSGNDNQHTVYTWE